MTSEVTNSKEKHMYEKGVEHELIHTKFANSGLKKSVWNFSILMHMKCTHVEISEMKHGRRNYPQTISIKYLF